MPAKWHATARTPSPAPFGVALSRGTACVPVGKHIYSLISRCH
jgi:hypothetical protein